MNAGKPWSEDEVKYLEHHYLNKHPREIGLDLGKSYSPVIQQLYNRRLSSKGRKLKNVSVQTSGSNYIKIERCLLPVFHPVMLGLYPVSRYQHGSSNRWRKRRAIILKMHDYCCVYCGNEANTVDHIVPVNLGGTDDPINLVAACSDCNSGFGDKIKHIEMKISYQQPVDK